MALSHKLAGNLSYARDFGVSASAVYASFWLRLAALTIDAAVLWAVVAGLHATFDWIVASGQMQPGDRDVLLQLCGPCVAAWYFCAFEGGMGSTPGKTMLMLQVQADGNRPVGLRRAICRNLFKAVSVLVLGVGLLMPFWTRRGQALHDVLAGCVVVRTGG